MLLNSEILPHLQCIIAGQFQSHLVLFSLLFLFFLAFPFVQLILRFLIVFLIQYLFLLLFLCFLFLRFFLFVLFLLSIHLFSLLFFLFSYRSFFVVSFLFLFFSSFSSSAHPPLLTLLPIFLLFLLISTGNQTHLVTLLASGILL